MKLKRADTERPSPSMNGSQGKAEPKHALSRPPYATPAEHPRGEAFQPKRLKVVPNGIYMLSKRWAEIQLYVLFCFYSTQFSPLLFLPLVPILRFNRLIHHFLDLLWILEMERDHSFQRIYNLDILQYFLFFVRFDRDNGSGMIFLFVDSTRQPTKK